MNTIQPATVTDIQALRAATLRLITTMVDTEHRPAPEEIVMRVCNGGRQGSILVARLEFEQPEHVTAWVGLERAEGYLFKHVHRVASNGLTETFQAQLIGYLTPVWHGWEQVYFNCSREIPTVNVAPAGAL